MLISDLRVRSGQVGKDYAPLGVEDECALALTFTLARSATATYRWLRPLARRDARIWPMAYSMGLWPMAGTYSRELWPMAWAYAIAWADGLLFLGRGLIAWAEACSMAHGL